MLGEHDVLGKSEDNKEHSYILEALNTVNEMRGEDGTPTESQIGASNVRRYPK